MSKNGKIDAVNYRIGKKKYNLTWYAKLIADGEEQKAIDMIMEKTGVSKEEAEKVVEDLKLYNKQVEEKKSKPKSKLPLIIVIIIILILAGSGYLVYQKVFTVPNDATVTIETENFDYNTGEYQDTAIWIMEEYCNAPVDELYTPENSKCSPLGVLMYRNNKDRGSFLKVTPTFETSYDDEGIISNLALATDFDVKAMTQEDFEKEIQSYTGNNSDLNVNKMNDSCWGAVYKFLNVSPRTAGFTSKTYNIQEYVKEAEKTTWADAYINHGITTKTNSIDFIGATIVEYDYDNEYGDMRFYGDEPNNNASFIYQEMNMDLFNRETDHVFACFYKANVTTMEMEGEVPGLSYIPNKNETKDVYVVVSGVFNNDGEIASGKGGICGISPLYDEDIEYNTH